MERRSKLGDVPETEVPKSIERSPLIDPRKLRSCRSTPAARSLCRPAYSDIRKTPSKANHSLKTISEFGQPNGALYGLNRSQSAPHPRHSPCPNHIRSPQYGVNPIYGKSARPFPERMNYGIAGYNTARPRSVASVPESTTRPRSFSRSIPEPSKRPRSFSGVVESKARARSFTSVPDCKAGQLQTRGATRSVLWRSWTRRFREKMGRVRVRDTCSKLLSRFRGSHLLDHGENFGCENRISNPVFQIARISNMV